MCDPVHQPPGKCSALTCLSLDCVLVFSLWGGHIGSSGPMSFPSRKQPGGLATRGGVSWADQPGTAKTYHGRTVFPPPNSHRPATGVRFPIAPPPVADAGARGPLAVRGGPSTGRRVGSAVSIGYQNGGAGRAGTGRTVDVGGPAIGGMIGRARPCFSNRSAWEAKKTVSGGPRFTGGAWNRWRVAGRREGGAGEEGQERRC